jgi:hypothetical protein
VNPRKHVKFLTLISVISIVSVVGIVALTQNVSLAIVIGLTSDAIQIVLYGMWLLQKEVNLSKVPEQVEEIHTTIMQEKEESRVTGEIVSRLVREGAVREDELLSLVRNKEIVLAFPYAEGLKGQILQMTKGQPLATLLSKIGFVRVALFQNLMVIMADSLPKQLRDIDRLNSFIKKRLPKDWDRIADKVKERYPEERYPTKFERWRSRAAFKVSYILASSRAQDFLIDYVRKNSFTTEFQKHIAGRIDRRELKKILKLRRHKVREIVSRISIEFLLTDIPRSIQELIMKNEDEIRKALGVKIITDYRLLVAKNVTGTLAKLVPDMEEALLLNYSTVIIAESQKCYESLKKLGTDLG